MFPSFADYVRTDLQPRPWGSSSPPSVSTLPRMVWVMHGGEDAPGLTVTTVRVALSPGQSMMSMASSISRNMSHRTSALHQEHIRTNAGRGRACNSHRH